MTEGGRYTAPFPSRVIMSAPDLSVVVPAFNESSRLGRSIDAIARYLDSCAPEAEIVVVDDGSQDGTAALARELLADRRARVLSNAVNRGKGFSVRRGVLEARGRLVLITDADLSCSIDQHQTLARAMCERKLDVAIGSRQLSASNIAVRQHPGRELMGRAFNVCVRAVTGLPYGDTQCGFKLVDRERTRPLFERMTIDRFAFDVEFLLLCAKAGLVVGEVPVIWRNSPDSRVSLIGDSTRMLWDLARLALRRSGSSRRV